MVSVKDIIAVIDVQEIKTVTEFAPTQFSLTTDEGDYYFRLRNGIAEFRDPRANLLVENPMPSFRSCCEVGDMRKWLRGQGVLFLSDI